MPMTTEHDYLRVVARRPAGRPGARASAWSSSAPAWRGSSPRRSCCAPGTSRWSSRRSSASAGASTRCASRSRPACTPKRARCASRARTSSRWPTSSGSGCATHRFTMDNPQAYCYLFGRKRRLREVDAKPAPASARTSPSTSAARRAQRVGARARAVRRRASQRRATTRWAEIVARVRPLLDARVPRGAGLVGGGDRDVRAPDQPGVADELVVPRAAARGDRAASTPTWCTSTAAWTCCRARSCRSSRGRIRFGAKHGRDRPVRRTASRVHYQTAAGRVRVHAATTRSSRCRSRCCATSRCSSRSRGASSARSASCTTTRRPRSSSSAGAASGRRTTASSAAAR